MNYRALEKDKVKAIVRSKAIKNNIDPDLFERIAYCESNFNPQAQNQTSTASGVFQFLDSTFYHWTSWYGIAYAAKNDPETQSELAALMIRDGGLSHWNASRSCWDY